MAKLFFGMNQSLDGYVDHDKFGPDEVLFRHFIEGTRRLTGSLYGTVLYGLMRYWDDERPEWDAARREYAIGWRAHPKWVVSRSLKEVGPNASLVRGDLETFVRRLKAEHEGEIEVGGTLLAKSLGEMGLIDEYRIYLHPVVLGGGTPYFAGVRPALKLTGSERIGESVVRLSYVPA